MTVLGMIISGARYAVENPIPLRIPSVAAPHPNSVNGPRNIPSGARTANAILITSVLFGITPPSSALKYGTQSSAALLKIGSTSRNPTSGAVSTTPSKKSLLIIRQV